jgi:biopolymer transport protein ExbD
MKFREHHQIDEGIDLTPFIDVVFMLLLFFVVSTTLFKGATQLGVQLPQANAQTLTKDNNMVEIGVDAKGFFYLNGISIGSSDPRRLKAALTSKLGENRSLPVVLVGDKAAPHQAVVTALEVASELGIHKVRIVAQQHSRQKNS